MRKGAILLAILLLPVCVRAQFIGYTSPQTVSVPKLLNAVSTPQVSAVVTNLGQSSHYLIYTTSGTITTIALQFEGSMDCSNFVRISDIATDPLGGGLFASGYYPCVRVNLTAISGGGTVTVGYSGTSVAPGPPVGVFAVGSVFKSVLVTGAAANATSSYTVQLPPAGSGGRLYFTYHGVAPSGATIGVTAGPDSTHTTTVLSSTAIAANTTTQGFTVQPKPANVAMITFTTGGATAATYDLTYQFNQGGTASGSPVPPMSLNFAHASVSLTANGTTTAASITGSGQVYAIGCSVTTALGTGTTTASAVANVDGTASQNLNIYSVGLTFVIPASDFATGTGSLAGDRFVFPVGPLNFSSSFTFSVTVSGASLTTGALDCFAFYGSQL